ncbi:hypothetical protein OSB04_030396, partial [Centaurea solstitialis]
MAFAANPLALSVPDPIFESWLRDSGYLEVLDQRTSDLHRISTAAAATHHHHNRRFQLHNHRSAFRRQYRIFPIGIVILHRNHTLSIHTKSVLEAHERRLLWRYSVVDPRVLRLLRLVFISVVSFASSYESYGERQAILSQLRYAVHRLLRLLSCCFVAANVLVLFCCCYCVRYQIPIALVGLVSSLALWDLFAYWGKRWGLDDYPIARECLLRLLQCVNVFYLASTYQYESSASLSSNDAACLIPEANSRQANNKSKTKIEIFAYK